MSAAVDGIVPPPRPVASDLDAALAAAARRVDGVAQAPLVVVDDKGRARAHGADDASRCALARGEVELTRDAHGQWSCPRVGCPHHGAFTATTAADRAPDATAVVHCESNAGLRSAVSELARLAIDAELDRRALLDELERRHEEVNWLYRLGDLLRRDSSEMLEQILRHAAELLPVTDARIWHTDAATSSYRAGVSLSEASVDGSRDVIDRPPDADESLLERGPIIVRRADAPDVPGFIQAMARRVGGASVALPLESEESILGVAVFRLDDRESPLTTSELRLFVATARELSLCLRVRLLLEELRRNEGLRREVEIAREIQHGLFPQRIPEHPAFDLWAGCVTAAQVGGDYYDLLETPRGLGLLVADVSGHSVASGLMSMSFRSSFRHHLDAGCEIDDILSRVNRSLYDELRRSGHFLSAFYAELDPASRKLRYVNAGHNRPFVVRAGGREVVDLAEGSLLIGVLPETSQPVGEIDLSAGDLVVIYTDGIIEAENQHGEMFGIERLREHAARVTRRNSKLIYHQLLKEMYVFQDERFNKDDVTLVVLKVR